MKIGINTAVKLWLCDTALEKNQGKKPYT